MEHLISPHGGELVDLMAAEERVQELKSASIEWSSWDMTVRQICDLELLLNGGFSPLTGFMNQADYAAVRDRMHLSDGALWPIPITLDVTEELAGKLASKSQGGMLALRDLEGTMLAALHVEEIYRPDLEREAERVFGTTNPEHPGVDWLLNRSNPCYVGGRLEGTQAPARYDFRTVRYSPARLRREFTRLGWRRAVAYQTREPMHRAQHELTLRAAKKVEASVLIHPVVGQTKQGDLSHYTRIHCYQAIMDKYPHQTAMLAVVPLAMRMAGPREAVWHAIIRKNFGATHFIVGRDHAGAGSDSGGRPFYGPFEAQDLVRRVSDELGVEMVPLEELVYVEDQDAYMPLSEVPEGARTLTLSDADLKKRLAEGRDIPEWFTFPEVADQLRRSHPPRNKQGFTVFFTGLSGSGKSTVANVLMAKFLEMGGRPVTLLDGDIVRTNLSSELGFSREHRDINIRRIGFVASEITKNGGIAICAPIAPYDRIRREVRQMVESGGGFILVHVNAPLEVCERRDRKGLYAKARAGVIKEFTGISDPYEEPADADVLLPTQDLTPEEAAQQVILYLEREGYVGAAD
ncbi:MAG: bifunctional sulfate adenylyltransferase/adenylylsulfate kinase [Planctomycetota bacterium]